MIVSALGFRTKGLVQNNTGEVGSNAVTFQLEILFTHCAKLLSYYDELNLGCSLQTAVRERVGRVDSERSAMGGRVAGIQAGCRGCRLRFGSRAFAAPSVFAAQRGAPVSAGVCKFEAPATATHSHKWPARVRVSLFGFSGNRRGETEPLGLADSADCIHRNRPPV